MLSKLKKKPQYDDGFFFRVGEAVVKKVITIS